MGVAGLGDGGPCTDDDDHGDGDVDEERPSPAGPVDEAAADERADRSGDAAETGPRPDCGGPVGLAEACLQDGEAAGREQCATDALQDPSRDEHADARCDAAEQGRGREPQRADEEDPASSEPVAEGPAQQDERRERQEVAGQDPLQRGDVGVQVVADLG